MLILRSLSPVSCAYENEVSGGPFFLLEICNEYSSRPVCRVRQSDVSAVPAASHSGVLRSSSENDFEVHREACLPGSLRRTETDLVSAVHHTRRPAANHHSAPNRLRDWNHRRTDRVGPAGCGLCDCRVPAVSYVTAQCWEATKPATLGSDESLDAWAPNFKSRAVAA